MSNDFTLTPFTISHGNDLTENYYKIKNSTVSSNIEQSHSDSNISTRRRLSNSDNIEV